MHTTYHAARRLKERVGLPKKALDRTATIAYSKGMGRRHATGRLEKYFDALFSAHHSKPKDIKIYGEMVYIYSLAQVLITVMPLPSEYKAAVRKHFKKGLAT